jgi:hypothetical protein
VTEGQTRSFFFVHSRITFREPFLLMVLEKRVLEMFSLVLLHRQPDLLSDNEERSANSVVSFATASR